MPSSGDTCSASLDPTNSCALALASMMHPSPGVRGQQLIEARSGTYHRASRAAFRQSGWTMTPGPFISCFPATIRSRCVGRPSRLLTEQIRSVSQAYPRLIEEVTFLRQLTRAVELTILYGRPSGRELQAKHLVLLDGTVGTRPGSRRGIGEMNIGI
jgi:hypothetical protein